MIISIILYSSDQLSTPFFLFLLFVFILLFALLFLPFFLDHRVKMLIFFKHFSFKKRQLSLLCLLWLYYFILWLHFHRFLEFCKVYIIENIFKVPSRCINIYDWCVVLETTGTVNIVDIQDSIHILLNNLKYFF